MMKQLFCSTDECIGCMACRNICPTNAINITPDAMECNFPSINTDLCIDCGLCNKACPSINDINKSSVQDCYAAWTNNIPDRVDCASGGIATAVSRYIIQHDGVVFGAAYDKDLVLHHKMVTDEEGLASLKGSKYTQSDVRYTYRETKDVLITGKLVLYIGTPCQIAGLYGYLQKKYDNLYTIDLICHGTPPNIYLSNYVKYKYHDINITNVKFRGEYDFCLTAYHKEKLINKTRADNDIFFSAYLDCFIYRDICYKCPFANVKRSGDMTIGDFWGLNRNTLHSPYDGRISLVLVNTSKGIHLFDNVKNIITYQKRDIAEAIANNEQLEKPVSVRRSRLIFKRIYPYLKFVKSINVIYFVKNIKIKIRTILKQLQ